MYGYAKNDRANIDSEEEAQFRDAAKFVLALSEEQLSALVDRGDFIEVEANE